MSIDACKQCGAIFDTDSDIDSYRFTDEGLICMDCLETAHFSEKTLREFTLKAECDRLYKSVRDRTVIPFEKPLERNEVQEFNDAVSELFKGFGVVRRDK